MAHIEATADTFEQEVLKSDVLTLVDFWAAWCGPCRILGPIVEDISNEYEGKLKVVKINVDENDALADKYNITSIPSVKFFKNGKIVSEFVGVKQKDELKEILSGLLSNDNNAA
ncbi:MAG: thioredoxin [Candidatus Gracilibacteria bacterium]